MKLKLSLGNSAKAALLSASFFLYISLSGCQSSLEPTYQEKDIPRLVRQICKDEYSLDVVTERTETTLWVYIPFTKILDKEFGIKEGKVLDEQMTDKLRNILSTVGRVVLSANKTPEFFALWSSDINIGFDYIIIGNMLDIKKAYAESIPPTELNRRYVMKFIVNREAIGDTTGRHAKFYNVRMPDFLTQEIVQRVAAQFQEDDFKKYLKVDKIDGIFNNDTFILEYSVKRLGMPGKPIDVLKEILDTVTYCVKTYEFESFTGVEVTDLDTREKTVLNKAQVMARRLPDY